MGFYIFNEPSQTSRAILAKIYSMVPRGKVRTLLKMKILDTCMISHLKSDIQTPKLDTLCLEIRDYLSEKYFLIPARKLLTLLAIVHLEILTNTSTAAKSLQNAIARCSKYILSLSNLRHKVTNIATKQKELSKPLFNHSKLQSGIWNTDGLL